MNHTILRGSYRYLRKMNSICQKEVKNSRFWLICGGRNNGKVIWNKRATYLMFNKQKWNQNTCLLSFYMWPDPSLRKFLKIYIVSLGKISVFRHLQLNLTSENSKKSLDRTDQVGNFYDKSFKMDAKTQKLMVLEI